jgi:hypothetical protein
MYLGLGYQCILSAYSVFVCKATVLIVFINRKLPNILKFVRKVTQAVICNFVFILIIMGLPDIPIKLKTGDRAVSA